MIHDTAYFLSYLMVSQEGLLIYFFDKTIVENIANNTIKLNIINKIEE